MGNHLDVQTHAPVSLACNEAEMRHKVCLMNIQEYVVDVSDDDMIPSRRLSRRRRPLWCIVSALRLRCMCVCEMRNRAASING